MSYSEATYSQCHGCGLCTVVCPAWQQRRDIRVSPHGHAKALQFGGEIQTHALFNCILCGACSSICPENIDLMNMLLNLRKISQKKPAQQKIHNEIKNSIKDAFNMQPDADSAELHKESQKELQKELRNIVFLTDPELHNDKTRLALITQLLTDQYDLTIANDDGHDISIALEAGINIPEIRLDRFLQPIRFSKKLIVCDGLLQLKLKQWLPYTEINSIGYELSKLAQIRKNITASDFYVIESRAYHSNFKKYVSYYDKLQLEKHCQLNLDLNRLAIPTGGTSDKKLRTPASFSTTKQANWMLSGKTFERIIVEDLKDFKVLSRVSNKPVVHIAELGS